jgi:hypothetical protein
MNTAHLFAQHEAYHTAEAPSFQHAKTNTTHTLCRLLALCVEQF